MAASKALIVNALESRYDYYSARNVLKDALRVSGLDDQSDYTSENIASLIEALAEVGERVEGVIALLQPHAQAGGAGKEKASTKKDSGPEPKAATDTVADPVEETTSKSAKPKADKKKPAKKKATKKK